MNFPDNDYLTISQSSALHLLVDLNQCGFTFGVGWKHQLDLNIANGHVEDGPKMCNG